MMIETSTPLETRLLHGYREQLIRYDSAVQILEQSECAAAEPVNMPWAQALHALLAEADALNAAMADDIAAWRRSGRSAGPELRDVLEKLGRRIHGLAKEIDRRSEEMRAQQQRLLPQMDEFIYQRRMLQAYVQSE